MTNCSILKYNLTFTFVTQVTQTKGLKAPNVVGG